MLDHTAIKLAYRNAVKNGQIQDLPPEQRCAWENIEFKPPTPNPKTPLECMWLRESYVSGDEIQAASDTIEGPGIYTIDIIVPKGAGTSELNRIQKAIAEVLHPATSILYTDPDTGVITEVSIDRTVRLSGREENSIWYVVSVQSTWRSYDIG